STIALISYASGYEPLDSKYDYPHIQVLPLEEHLEQYESFAAVNAWWLQPDNVQLPDLLQWRWWLISLQKHCLDSGAVSDTESQSLQAQSRQVAINGHPRHDTYPENCHFVQSPLHPQVIQLRIAADHHVHVKGKYHTLHFQSVNDKDYTREYR